MLRVGRVCLCCVLIGCVCVGCCRGVYLCDRVLYVCCVDRVCVRVVC